MYVLMYSMVDALDNVHPNLNEVYMAGLMTAPMVLLELVLMREAYQRKAWNAAIAGASIVALVACWILIREQAGIGDRQFLKSMIPHHGAAILMCGKASLVDPEIKQLCRRIVESQSREIAQMTDKLHQIEARAQPN